MTLFRSLSKLWLKWRNRHRVSVRSWVDAIARDWKADKILLSPTDYSRLLSELEDSWRLIIRTRDGILHEGKEIKSCQRIPDASFDVEFGEIFAVASRA